MKKYIVKQRLEAGEWHCVSPYFKKRRDAELKREELYKEFIHSHYFPVLRVIYEEVEKNEKTV